MLNHGSAEDPLVVLILFLAENYPLLGLFNSLYSESVSREVALEKLEVYRPTLDGKNG